MRVLVTGGAGFVGGEIVRRLVARGDQVRVLDSLAAHRRPPSLPDGVELRRADLLDQEAVEAAAEGVDAVCHQAAKVGLGVDFDDVAAYVSANALGTATLLRALWRTGFRGRLVVASSMVVYGEGRYRCRDHGETAAPPRRPEDLRAGLFDPRCRRCERPLEWATVSEEAPPDPRNVYAATKLHTEHLAFSYGRESGNTVCALRYHNVYGPNMPRDTPYAGVASIFRSAFASGRAPRVFEDGGQIRDFVHVRDVARANLLALDSTWTGACNVASGQPHSILDMARALAAGVGEDATAPQVTGEFRLGDVRHVAASADLASEALGFKAETSFASGMAEFARDRMRES